MQSKPCSNREWDKYTWYFRPPMERRFDRENWWWPALEVDKKGIDRAAALFEVVRRLPKVGEMVANIGENGLLSDGSIAIQPAVHALFLEWAITSLAKRWRKSKAAICLCFYGLKSWPKLSAPEKESWRNSVYDINGVDDRPPTEKCIDIFSQAVTQVSVISEMYRRAPLGEVEGFGEHLKQTAEFLNGRARHFALDGERIREAIAQSVLEAYQDGYVLIAASPKLTKSEIENLLPDVYRRARRVGRTGARHLARARCEDWLRQITAFERDYDNPDPNNKKKKGSSTLLTPYARILKRVSSQLSAV
jgi:hypothetical protein